MTVKAENKRVSITQGVREQELCEVVKARREDDGEYVTPTDIYRAALLNAHYADSTKKPLESMGCKELARFVASYDEGVPGSGDAATLVKAMCMLRTKLDAEIAVWESFEGILV